MMRLNEGLLSGNGIFFFDNDIGTNQIMCGWQHFHSTFQHKRDLRNGAGGRFVSLSPEVRFPSYYLFEVKFHHNVIKGLFDDVLIFHTLENGYQLCRNVLAVCKITHILRCYYQRQIYLKHKFDLQLNVICFEDPQHSLFKT